MENTEKREVVETVAEQKPTDVLPNPAVIEDPLKEDVQKSEIEPKEHSRVFDATKATLSVLLWIIGETVWEG